MSDLWSRIWNFRRPNAPTGMIRLPGKPFEERDKPACGAYIVANVNPEREKRYGWMELNLGCGLCQTGVPCEHKRP